MTISCNASLFFAVVTILLVSKTTRSLTLSSATLQVRSQSIYAVVTELGAQNTETIQYVTRINLATGESSNVVQTFIIAGDSQTLDGISTFDPTKNTYYYATDFVAPFVYQANVKTASLLPPIYLGGYNTISLLFDNAASRLLTLVGDNKDNSYLVTLPVNGGPSQVYLQFPANFNFNYVSGFALHGHLMYNIVKTGKNNTATYVVATTDISQPTPGQQTVHEVHCSEEIYPEYAVWDSTLNALTGFGSTLKAGQLAIYFFKVSPTSGSCSTQLVQTPAGIVTAYTYDETHRNFYLAFAPDGPSQILRYNVALGKIDQTVTLKGGVNPESIEFSSV